MDLQRMEVDATFRDRKDRMNRSQESMEKAEGGPGDDPAAVPEAFPAGETGFCRRPARHDSMRRPARRFRMWSRVVGVRPQVI